MQEKHNKVESGIEHECSVCSQNYVIYVCYGL